MLIRQEKLIPVQYTDSSGFHDLLIHYSDEPDSYLDPNISLEYFATTKDDQYEMGVSMPIFRFSPETSGGYDGVSMLFAVDADFSSFDEFTWISMRATAPFDVTVTATNRYNDLNCKTSEGLDVWNETDAKITWYALDGDDRIEGGSRNIDIAYGGLGNDYYQIDNVGDKAVENQGEGFDVVSISCLNYRFDYNTSIEAAYVWNTGSIDPEFIPKNLILLDYLVENRGPGTSSNIKDFIEGTALNDGLLGSDSNGFFDGKDGRDYIDGAGGDDTIEGGLGNDSLNGGVGADLLFAGTGNDVVDAGAGNDLIIGGNGAGNDRYVGGLGIDTIKYTSATAGITVNLSLASNQAKSTLSGDKAGIGVDQLSEIENVIAGNYDDFLVGNAFANRITAGRGNDTVNGGAGADTMLGGFGSDVIYGGSDKVRDVFCFNATGELIKGIGRDKICDFLARTDVIDLSGIDANTRKTGDQSFLFSNMTSKAYSVWYGVADVDGNKSTRDLIVYADVNGDAKADMEIGLINVKSLTANDFIL